ncbi:efflux RND transporter periplasmic adaptor subunit [Halieaceae bacterium IMCC14734]|uniref:Efflux RND transporter periplasmic adaptor subunit n=1 Tax=Candidatus Litorirhabdus singularis TaxID=2518993 RepID=A0ABT3TAF6_9GAMM|nr:efflux RND transporter periplasmic adaptor subunit [Candidatus Litorirhabdus singularis]MCX2979256.1 efflux RND transporter periplasmic adaptor subunit [Candidatus Litorirhabdus singularis]
MASSAVRKFLPVLLLLGSVAVTAVLIANRPQTVMAPPPERAALVDVAEVVLQDLRIEVQAQGTVQPHRETTLVPEVSGKIIYVAPNLEAGNYVAADEVLLRIDDRDYQAHLLRAKAAVASAQSNLAQERGRAEVAFKEWKKLPKSTQRSQQATDLYLRKPQTEQAEAELLSAQADMQRAADDLDRTVIRAPYDSLVKEKQADLGQYVSPGTSLAAVFSVDYAEVRLAIPQSKLNYLELPGVTGYDVASAPVVDLYTDVAGEVSHWPARLQRTEGVFDERSRVLFTVARVDDPYALGLGDHKPLRVGSFVKANIQGKLMQNLVVLPRFVLRAGNNIWVIDKEMTLRNRKVQTLRTEGRDIYVSEGLQNGDLVCLTTISAALPGMKVRINDRRSTLLRQDSAMEAAGAPDSDTNQASDDKNGADQTSAATSSDGSKAA